MESLKEIVEALASLPEIAIYIALMLLIYKVAIVGSVYAVIRYVVDRIATTVEVWKTATVNHTYTLSLKDKNNLTRLLIDGTEDQFLEFVMQLRGASPITRYNGLRMPTSDYVHDCDLSYALTALREKQERDEAAKAAKVQP